MSKEQFMQILEQTVMGLIVKQAFFGRLLMEQELIIDGNVQTACTDGKSIRVNQAWFMGVKEHLRLFIFAHEVMHSAMCHHLRRGNRLPLLWNIATDYVINILLVDAGLISAAECAKSYLYDAKYRGKSEEQVYSMLVQDAPVPPPVNPSDEPQDDEEQDGDEQDGEGNGPEGDENGPEGDENGEGNGPDGDGEGKGTDGNGKPSDDEGNGTGEAGDDEQGDAPHDDRKDGKSCGEVEDGKNAGDKQAAENEQVEWTVKMEQAARAADRRGQAPGWIKEMIENAKIAQIDWVEALWEFCLQFGRGDDDHTFSQLNHRMRHIEQATGGRIAKRVSYDAVELVIGIDTSGSVPSWALGLFAGEINAIREALNCKIHLVQCDTRIVDTQVSESSEEPFIIEYKGRGGTEFEPVFKYAADNAPECQALVYLTDLECTLPVEPTFPVLWVTPWKVCKPAYGTLVSMKGDKYRR